MADEDITAALVVIGDEILSGRTKDRNIGTLADFLTRTGIVLKEVRIVGDEQAAIVDAVNALRATHTYVFTTGGIGPTHDDITADAIGAAFGVPVDIDARAVAMMRERYSPEELTDARIRMARIPQGASLVANSVSKTPGFWIGNVIVMAGVPKIMEVMLDAVEPQLTRGRPRVTRTVRVEHPESGVAPALARVQGAHAAVQIGSYPFFAHGKVGTHVVIRAREETDLQTAHAALWQALREDGIAEHAHDADDE